MGGFDDLVPVASEQVRGGISDQDVVFDQQDGGALGPLHIRLSIARIAGRQVQILYKAWVNQRENRASL